MLYERWAASSLRLVFAAERVARCQAGALQPETLLALAAVRAKLCALQVVRIKPYTTLLLPLHASLCHQSPAVAQGVRRGKMRVPHTTHFVHTGV